MSSAFTRRTVRASAARNRLTDASSDASASRLGRMAMNAAPAWSSSGGSAHWTVARSERRRHPNLRQPNTDDHRLVYLDRESSSCVRPTPAPARAGRPRVPSGRCRVRGRCATRDRAPRPRIQGGRALRPPARANPIDRTRFPPRQDLRDARSTPPWRWSRTGCRQTPARHAAAMRWLRRPCG